MFSVQCYWEIVGVVRLSSSSKFIKGNTRGGVTVINLDDKSVKVQTRVEIYSTVLYLITPPALVMFALQLFTCLKVKHHRGMFPFAFLQRNSAA